MEDIKYRASNSLNSKNKHKQNHIWVYNYQSDKKKTLRIAQKLHSIKKKTIKMISNNSLKNRDQKPMMQDFLNVEKILASNFTLKKVLQKSR